jgi:hypothetical protein
MFKMCGVLHGRFFGCGLRMTAGGVEKAGSENLFIIFGSVYIERFMLAARRTNARGKYGRGWPVLSPYT